MPDTPNGSLTSLQRRAWRQRLWAAKRATLRHTPWPILVGPWHGEVGFEALYWTPFLSHWRAQDDIARARVIPISRGGAAAWYDAPVGVELYAMRSLQDVRCENWRQHAESGFQKQMTISPFDRAVLADAAQTLGLTRYHVLHPAWMYHVLGPYWTNDRGLSWLHTQVAYPPLPDVSIPGLEQLPDVFTAVKFYFRPTFAASSLTVSFARETIRTIARLQPVVVLTSGIHADDHLDFVPELEPNVHRLSDLVPMTAETNLAVQAAVLARAQGFVGTYGGTSQLALRLRKPVVTFYEEWHSTAVAHRYLSEALALQFGVPFHVLRLRDVALLQQLLPRVDVSQGAPRGASSVVTEWSAEPAAAMVGSQPVQAPALLAAGG